MLLSSVHLLNPVSSPGQVEMSTAWSELDFQESGIAGGVIDELLFLNQSGSTFPES